MDPYLRRDPKYQSFVTVFRGFQYVGKVLEPYTKAGLRRVHQVAYRANAGKPQCLQQCSRLHGKNTQTWCQTCKAWKNILAKSRTRPFTRWENSESWNWANDFETIVPVFLPEFWKGDVRLDEFGTACHLWSTCNEYRLDRTLLKKLREFRNKHFGHNPDLKVAEADKKRVFDALKTLLRENDVQRFVNIGRCHQELDKIAQGDELNQFMDDIDSKLRHTNLTMDTISDEQTLFRMCLDVWFENVCLEMQQQNKVVGAILRTLENGKRLLILGTLFVLVLAAAILGVYFWMHSDYDSPVLYSDNSGCVDENYSHPFPQDLPLLPYLMEHSNFIGRKWLLDEIKTYVEPLNSTNRGVIITADMGYGKSALIKHILCASKQHTAHSIRSQIVAFHVCKYDVPSTKDPQRFIYRLIGFLATRFPEYGGIISKLSQNLILYSRELCKENVIACFDQGILVPLLKMKNVGSKSQIIIVDALDECFDKRLDDNEIYTLLKARYNILPSWMKLIITSRPTYIIGNLKRLYLDQTDRRNIADIKQYVEDRAFRNQELRHIVKEMDIHVNQTEGNFLFVVHFIDYLITNNGENMHQFPATLDGVYHMNFERVFPSGDEFETAKIVLELIVASLHPLSQIEVETILESINVSKVSNTQDAFKKLGFCFRATTEITLIHQSLNAWLISEDNNFFRIKPSYGHSRFSLYLLSQAKTNAFDIVNTAIHIGNSNDPTLTKAFGTTFSSENVAKSTLHKLIWKSNSVAALQLILSLVRDVDSLNEGYVTPAFIAAAKGHLFQLKLLWSNGANLNFKVNDSYLISSPAQLDEIKHQYFFGYGLIHIASQFGHIEVVDFLLKHNESMRHSTNGLGQSISDLACENGHLNLLKNILSKYEMNTDRCLFYAAKNDHIPVIKTLAFYRKNVSCISRADSLQAISKLAVVDRAKPVLPFSKAGSSGDFLMQVLNIQDLWWTVYQESPLHAAINAKYEDTAVAVVKHYPHLAECIDAFGMTPFLLSVMKNNTKIFELLAERVSTDICAQINFDAFKMDTHEGIFTKTVCPVGGSYAHLDGLHGRFDMTKILQSKHIHVDWLAKDSDSITAVHYAACNGNQLFLVFIHRQVEGSFSKIRSDNQSTPYHSAAICGSLHAFAAMTYLNDNIPNVVDSENKGVLHYLVLREFGGLVAIADLPDQFKALSILASVIKHSTSYNLSSLDSFRRNILHYALKNGHFLVTRHLRSMSDVLFRSLLLEKDINGLTPIEYAVHSHANSSYLDFPIPFESKYFDIFNNSERNHNMTLFLSSWEMTLVEIMHTNVNDIVDLYSSVLTEIILKSHCITAAFLAYFERTVRTATLGKHVIESIPQSPPPASLGAIARFKPQLFSMCGKPLSDSPFHLIAYKYNAAVLMSNTRFLDLAFGSRSSKYYLSCSDSTGYNAFHYAIMGGNILMAVQLFNNGISITNKKVSARDILWMILLTKERQFEISNFPCRNQLSCMDYLMYNTLERYIRGAIVLSDICSNHSVGLSLIHIVAVNGLGSSMDLLLTTFGSELFMCMNRDGITPLYLLHIFHSRADREMFNLTIQKEPVPETETLLLLGLFRDFPSYAFDVGKLQCHFGINIYSNRKVTQCLNLYFYYESSNRKAILRPLYDVLMRACRIYEFFSKALYSKDENPAVMLSDVKNHVSIFQAITYEMNKTFNYPNLKKLIQSKELDIACKRDKHFMLNISCIKIYNEFAHILNKMIVDLHIKLIHSQRIGILLNHETFLKTYMSEITEALVKSGLNYMLNRVSITRPSLVFDNLDHCEALDEKQMNFIFQHSYLRVLKKSFRYQIFEKYIMHSVGRNMPLDDTHYFAIAHTVPKPFQDVLKYINASSYS